MGNYMPPEGFQYDANSGLYFRQDLINDGYHQPYTVMNWFDPRTGKITQNPVQQGGYSGANMPPQGGYPGGDMLPQQSGYPGGNVPQPPSGKKGGKTALIICLVVLLCALSGVGSVLLYKYVIADDNKEQESSEITASTSGLVADNSTEMPSTAKSVTEAPTETPSTERVTTEAFTEKKTTATTEAVTEKMTTASTDAPYVDYGIGWIEGDYEGTDPNLEGAQPTISINGNGHMDMTLNFGEGFNSYKCTYETSGKKHEMDDLYVYVTVINPSNGIPSKCTLVFSDSPDYFLFLDEGFGLMGYSGAPYYFTRVD